MARCRSAALWLPQLECDRVVARHLSRLSTNAVQKRACAHVTRRGTQQSMTSTFEPDADWLDLRGQPAQAAVQAATGLGRRRTAMSSALATSSPTRRNGSTRRPTRPRKSCSSCTTSSASTAASSSRRPVTARTTARSSTRCAPRGDKARGVATIRPASPGTNWPTCTRQASAASGSTSSGGSPTPSPMIYYRGLVDLIAEFGWHIVIYFEAPDLEERGTFSPACRRRSSSTTWAAPT